MLTAVLCACAVAVLVAPRGEGGRVARVLPRPAPVAVPAAGLSPLARRGAASLAGLALWWLAGGMVGAVLGLAAALAGPALLGRLDDTEADEAELAAALPLALDLLSACLAGGATTASALTAVAGALPGPLGTRLAQVASALVVGSPPAEAWQSLGQGGGPAGAAARALARSAEGGASVAAGVLRVAADARREALSRSERAARRAGVLAVGPLGLCFLPAFLLLGVVPAIVGLAGPLLASL